MKKSSLKQYTAILNRLLSPGGDKARYIEEDDATKSLLDIKRIPFIIQLTLFGFCQKTHPDFFPFLCLLKFAIVRADELVYLQKKNLIRIHIDIKQFQRTTCWLRYLQKKTWTEKSVIIPEEVWEMFHQLKEDDYLVSFRTANGYRRKYRQIFNEFQKLHNQARYYTAHCWRHTGAIEVIMMGWRNGLSGDQAPKNAQYFLGHNTETNKKALAVQNYVGKFSQWNPLLHEVELFQNLNPNVKPILTSEQLVIRVRRGRGEINEISKKPKISSKTHMTIDKEERILAHLKTQFYNLLPNSNSFAAKFENQENACMIPWIPVIKDDARDEDLMELERKFFIEAEEKYQGEGECQEEDLESEEEDEEEEQGEDKEEQKEISQLEPIQETKLLINAEGRRMLHDKKSGFDFYPTKRKYGIKLISVGNDEWIMKESIESQQIRKDYRRGLFDKKKGIARYGKGVFLSSIMKVPWNSFPCVVCKMNITKGKKKLLGCDKCLQACHRACEKKKPGKIMKWASMDMKSKYKYSWYCWECSERVFNDKAESQRGTFSIEQIPTANDNQCKEHGHIEDLVEYKCHPNLKIPNNLLYAIEEQSLVFNDSMIESPGCPENTCKGSVNKEVHILTPQHMEEFVKFKEESILGKYPGLELYHYKTDKFKGWSVVASEDIPKNTILCQYAGNVVFIFIFFRNNFLKCLKKSFVDFWEDTDVYELTSFNDSSRDVVICPVTHCNIAKFINAPGPKEKANVSKNQFEFIIYKKIYKKGYCSNGVHGRKT